MNKGKNKAKHSVLLPGKFRHSKKKIFSSENLVHKYKFYFEKVTYIIK